MTRQRWLLLAIVVVLVALLVYAVLFINRGATEASESRQFPPDATGVALVAEGLVLDDLGPISASADLMAYGVVEDVSARYHARLDRPRHG